MDEDRRPWWRSPGWIVSAMLHAGVVALTFLSFAPTYELPPVEEFVPVSMLPIADATSVKASAKAEDPKPEPKPAAKPDPKPKTAPKPAEEPPPPAPEPEPKPKPPEPQPETPPPPPPPKETPPPPAPTPEPAAEAEPSPAPPTPRAKPKEVTDPPKEVAEAEPEPEPAKDPPKEKPPKEKPPKEKPPKDPPKEPEEEPFDIDAAIAGVEDKEKEDEPADESPDESPPADDASKRGKNPSAKETAAIQDAFKTQVSRCWSPPVGAPSPEKLIVVIRIRLNRDGSLSGMPEYMEPGKMSDPYYQAAAESGRRAIIQCQNYDLPADSYDQWKLLEVEFDPSKMIGL